MIEKNTHKKSTKKRSLKSKNTSQPNTTPNKKPGAPRFVVQKHTATNLHYDFRLELDGVLKSWAIPKEPPTNPNIRRLAIQVEDHDLSYIDFEGKIKEGDYGAGKVELWDSGTYDMETRKDYKLVFFLHGKRLRGRYTILRFEKAGPNTWLFFKTKEEHRIMR
ncbi:MAG TPA: 3'-phosphoesterase [Candidatus Woesearchaeota archaeon]|nr:3'-phosphoesterase [Candidatus Woesearchaeota archaeon]